jgi:hypothetical protein
LTETLSFTESKKVMTIRVESHVLADTSRSCNSLSLAKKEKEECTHFYLSIVIESIKNVFECMESYELISSRVNTSKKWL